jgi:hypothetical protein
VLQISKHILHSSLQFIIIYVITCIWFTPGRGPSWAIKPNYESLPKHNLKSLAWTEGYKGPIGSISKRLCPVTPAPAIHTSTAYHIHITPKTHRKVNCKINYSINHTPQRNNNVDVSILWKSAISNQRHSSPVQILSPVWTSCGIS